MVIFALFSSVSWRPYIAPKEEWYRKWKPTPVFLPEKLHGQRSLMGYSPWSHRDWDTTEQAHIDVHILIPRTCEYVSFHGKRGHAAVSKDPEMERQFWIISMGTMSSKGPCIKEWGPASKSWKLKGNGCTSVYESKHLPWGCRAGGKLFNLSKLPFSPL